MQTLSSVSTQGPQLFLSRGPNGTSTREIPCTLPARSYRAGRQSECLHALFGGRRRGPGLRLVGKRKPWTTCVRVAAETAEPSIAANPETTPVTISLQKEAAFGFQYAIVGGDPVLGAWNPAKAAVLDWSEGHVWSKTLDLPPNSSVEYKFILVNNDMEAVEWQPGENRTIVTSAGANTIQGQWEESQKPPLTSENDVSDKVTAEGGKAVEDSGLGGTGDDVSNGVAAAETGPSAEGSLAESDIAPAASSAIEKTADAAANVSNNVTAPKASSGSTESSRNAETSPPSSSSAPVLVGASALLALALIGATVLTPDSATLVRSGDLKGAVSVALNRLNPGEKLGSLTDTVGQHSSKILSSSGETLGGVSKAGLEHLNRVTEKGLAGLSKVSDGGLGGWTKAASDRLGGLAKAPGNGFGGVSKLTGENLGGQAKPGEQVR